MISHIFFSCVFFPDDAECSVIKYATNRFESMKKGQSGFYLGRRCTSGSSSLYNATFFYTDSQGQGIDKSDSDIFSAANQLKRRF
jgi:hypothetical protein